jgi:hypothetical protein
MILENLKLSGKLNIVIKDQDGSVKDQVEVDNLVVTAGLTFIASRMGGTTQAVMSHMGVGSGTTAAAAGQTDLVSIVGSRVALTSTTPGTSNIVYVASFGAGVSTGAITEAGIFNNATAGSGTMLCRTTFAVINKGANDTMTVTWTVSLVAV